MWYLAVAAGLIAVGVLLEWRYNRRHPDPSPIADPPSAVRIVEPPVVFYDQEEES